MKLIATIPVRNEAWVAGLSLRVALLWCDEICVLNHASTDATVDILADLQHELPGRVHVISAPEAQWTEMQHRQMLLDLARAKGATHIAIVDADEVLTGGIDASGHCCVKGILETMRNGILQLPGYNLRGSIGRFHANGIWGRRWFSVAFRDDARLHWSAEQRNGYDHHHREPMGLTLQGYRPITQGAGGVMHLWGVTERRLIARHALYKITERLRWPDKHVTDIDFTYSLAVKGSGPHDVPSNWSYAKTPEAWWMPHQHLMKYLDLDVAPWQEAEAQRLYALHGRERFKGLDLFGVCE